MGERIMHTDIIRSTAYGDIPITEEQIYLFNQGVIGFSNITKYALFPFENSELFILHALSEELSFILIPAMKVEKELAFHIDLETVELLGVDSAEEVVPFLIVHIVEDKPYMNAKAPLLLVPSTHKGCQYVIADSNYSVREPLVMKDSESC